MSRNKRKPKRILWVNVSKLVVLIVSVVIAIGVVIYGYSSKNKVEQSEVVKFEQEEEMTAKQLYDVDFQADREEQIEALKEGSEYSFDNMLLVYNPYGLNVQSMYVYFNTSRTASVSYNVHVENEEIPDFTQTLYNGGEDNLSKTHEYQLIGLIPGVENTITFTIRYASGITDEKEITYTPDELTGAEYEILPSTDGTSDQELSDGLYVTFAEDNYVYYYDNAGVIRSEIPILGYRAHRLIFQDDKMYYSISKTKMAEMNSLGQVTRVFDFGDYELHHDYVFDGDGNIIVLGTLKDYISNEDRILKLDLTTGEVTQIIDMADFFPDYFEKYKENLETNELNEESYGLYDWIHLNTVNYIGDDTIIVSSRETSTIIKISDIYNDPTIEYMIGEESIWEGTGYEDLLLDKASDFVSQTGQHSVTYVEDDSLPEGQYYIYMFNNNIYKSATRPDYDWTEVFGESENTKMLGGDTSYFYKYLVDETTGTYDLVDSFEVPYSGFVSSVQEFTDNGNYLIDSGCAFTLGEYDSNQELIRSFELSSNDKSYCYRVYKYDFNGFYFYTED